MALWRSAGWPCRDGIELDLLAAGWIESIRDEAGRDSLRLTAGGLEVLQHARRRRVRSASLHDRIAARICLELHRQGRIVWRELMFRTPVLDHGTTVPAGNPAGFLPGITAEIEPSAGVRRAWRAARPDLFSIRNSSVESALHPVTHEIKASRSDLLADLRDTGKGAAYRSVSSETYYVFPEGIADAVEIPEDFGVWTLAGTPEDGTLSLLRPARFNPRPLDFGIWMVLARATPVHELIEPAQARLTEHDEVGRG